MKILKYSLIFALLISFSAIAQTLTLVNNTGGTLYFRVNSGGEFTPDLKEVFQLEQYASIETHVVDANTACDAFPTNPSTYITVKNEQRQIFGYVATGLVCHHLNLVAIDTYLGDGILYEYDNYRPDVTLTFSDTKRKSI